MAIRERAPDDFVALIELAREVHRHDGYPPYLPDDDFDRFLRSGQTIAAWVLVEADETIGHVSLHSGSSPGVVELAATELEVDPSSCGVVARLLVAPGSRRRGIGRRLLDHAATDCRRRGLTPVLDVVERFTSAISLYEHAGWVRLGSVDVRLPNGSEIREHVYSTVPPSCAERHGRGR